jgi:VIT1/CCC1 family predicted Fe2+/Mn2+ transporter
LGPTFAVKLLEKNESDDQISYTRLQHIPDILPIIRDEEQHEKELIGLIREDRLNYMGSVVLGLNDALVELTGALAGLTFALRDPSLIALTGSITGIAAAFSMAASEYLSTKSEDTGKHAGKASFYTGMAYLFTVTALIMPFLLLSNVYISLSITLGLAVLIIAGFNYYYSVVKDEKFSRRFIEMALLSLSVAALSFGVGFVLRKFFGIDA